MTTVVAFNEAWAVYAAVVFAGLAYQGDGTPSAVSSFAVNFPMASVFSFDFVDFMAELCNSTLCFNHFDRSIGQRDLIRLYVKGKRGVCFNEFS